MRGKFTFKPTAIATAPALLLGAAAVLALPAQADDYSSYREYGRVTRVVPIEREVQVSVPRQQCHEVRVIRERPAADTTGRTIVGGLLGAAVGSQFGHHGSGQNAATLAGGLLGASIGANSARRAGSVERVSRETRCREVEEIHTRTENEGYRVSYVYQGRHYTTRMPYDPGRRIPLDVSVAPALDD